jgi:hypothetical protein
MKLINLFLKTAQVFVALKICEALYLVHYLPKQHSIDNVLWWVSVLILDMWLNLIVFKTDTVYLAVKEPEKTEE